MHQFQQPQPSWQPSQQFYPQSQAILVNSTAAANPRNIATTT
jgi:hypothetical protein